MSTASQRVGIVGHTAFHADATLGNNNAGFHNSLYRGKYLGTSVTAEQWAAIRNGDFSDLFVGDYWTINGVNWRIAAFDYWMNAGTSQHHAVIVPDTALYNAQMYNTTSGGYEAGSLNKTDGGYTATDMYKTNLANAVTAINNAFGSTHVLTHKTYLSNACSNGVVSNWANLDVTVQLMSEIMVYGHHACASRDAYGFYYQTGYEKSQLPLFKHRHDLIGIGAFWWLRDVVTASYWAFVDSRGAASYAYATHSIGVRPAFAIY